MASTAQPLGRGGRVVGEPDPVESTGFGDLAESDEGVAREELGIVGMRYQRVRHGESHPGYVRPCRYGCSQMSPAVRQSHPHPWRVKKHRLVLWDDVNRHIHRLESTMQRQGQRLWTISVLRPYPFRRNWCEEGR